MTSAEAVLERLRSFTRKVEPRLTKELKKELSKILNDYTVITTQVSREVDRASIQGCCEALGVLKKNHIHTLSPKNLGAYLEEGWTHNEIAWMYNATLAQIMVKKRQLEALPKPSDVTNFELPPWLAGKKPEQLTDEEVATIARLMMVKEAASGNLDAAQKLMANFNSSIKSEMKKKWEEVKKIDYFYMSVFLSELIKAHKLADPMPKLKVEIGRLKETLDINELTPTLFEIISQIEEICVKGRVDVKAIYRKILGDLEEEIKEPAGAALTNLGKPRLKEVSQEELAAQESKMLKRGKWKKRKSWLSKEEKAGESDNPPGVMESAEEAGKEVTPASQEEGKVDWGAL